MKQRQRYREGDWFAVPLGDGGYGLGRIARSKRGVIAGYFFGPRKEKLPSARDLIGLRANKAILVSKFGDLGLIQGDWPVLGNAEADWESAAWPMPVFGRRESLTGRLLRVEYPDDNPNSAPRLVPVSVEEFDRLPLDGTLVQYDVEDIMTRIIRETE